MESKSFQKIMVHGSAPWVDRKRTRRASGETQRIPNRTIVIPLVRSFIVVVGEMATLRAFCAPEVDGYEVE